jgi:carboxyl-terminal processing protease
MQNLENQPAQSAAKPARPGMSRRSVVSIAIVVGIASFVLGTRADNLPYVSSVFSNRTPSSLDLSSVHQTYDVLKSKYAGDLDATQLIEGAKKGLVEAAGDPYTVYFTDKEAEEFLGDLEGTFSGIGAELSKKDDKLTIVSTIDGSPAKKSGLLANDNIVKVNEEDVTGWSVDQAVAKIRGEKGTTVKLTVIRNSSEVKTFSITRDTITNPSVTSEITPDNIGYMRVSRFAQNDTAALARTYAEEYKSKNVKAVVLDLRGNGGGYVTAAQDIASLWLGSGKIVVSERNGEKVIDELKTKGEPVLEGVPTVVLIDGGSASASEIVAGALRDYEAASLVGEKSFGKGSVQDITDAPGSGKLKVTIAKWFTPKGENIDKEGIKPDTEVKLTDEDITANRDPQKDKAFEQLR